MDNVKSEPQYSQMESKNVHLDKPLEGILVVDLTHVLSGPTCARMLADAGARVIHVERPKTGDDTRLMAPTSMMAPRSTSGSPTPAKNRLP